jgi:tetratricopeptide (TPR) repeat protein
MRKILVIILTSFIYLTTFSQSQNALTDTIKAYLSRATTNEEKIEHLSRLSRTLMTTNLAEAEKYGQQLTEVAETSRDRKLMFKALLANGERYSMLAGRKENLDKAFNYYKQALDLARQNGLDEQMVAAYLYMSELSRMIPEIEKALNYCNQAYSYVGSIKNDSLSARVYLELGSVYLGKNEKLLALRNYMASVRIAEDLKNKALLRLGYESLSVFYTGIEAYDKAIDYQTKVLGLEFNRYGQAALVKVQDLNKLGDIYAYKKSYDMAMRNYEKALVIADSAGFSPLKALVYQSIVNNYLRSNQPQKALTFFSGHPELKTFFEALNYGYFIDQSYAFIYSQLGRFDSARYYYNKVAPIFENDVNKGSKMSYYYQLGLMYKKTGENNKAVEYFTKAKLICDTIGELQTMGSVAKELDTLYQLKGDYKQAMYFNKLNITYKDSLDKLGKEKDLIQVEVAAEQQRQERLEKEELEAKKKRNNIQYMLIIIGIVSLFVVMVTMGMFKVSASTIKLVGFFAFLMFFEFIFLIFKKNIYSFTNGEPWKDLSFMIALAAILLPLHHWLEHKVIHYLTSHNRLTASGKGFMEKFLKRKK